MQHIFTKNGESSYTYTLRVNGIFTQPDVFLYGIIVKKLPASVRVTFKYEELND